MDEFIELGIHCEFGPFFVSLVESERLTWIANSGAATVEGTAE